MEPVTTTAAASKVGISLYEAGGFALLLLAVVLVMVGLGGWFLVKMVRDLALLVNELRKQIVDLLTGVIEKNTQAMKDMRQEVANQTLIMEQQNEALRQRKCLIDDTPTKTRLPSFGGAILVFLALVGLAGCSIGERSVGLTPTSTPVEAPLPADLDGLKAELKANRARQSILEGAITDARNEAIQTKLYVGIGACVLAGLVLIALGIWTTRRVFIQIGIAALGLAALGWVMAALVPYMLWIGIAVAVLMVIAAVWMLINRERTIGQVADAVDAAKEQVPAFADRYKAIFRQHIDGFAENIVHSVRENG